MHKRQQEALQHPPPAHAMHEQHEGTAVLHPSIPHSQDSINMDREYRGTENCVCTEHVQATL